MSVSETSVHPSQPSRARHGWFHPHHNRIDFQFWFRPGTTVVTLGKFALRLHILRNLILSWRVSSPLLENRKSHCNIENRKSKIEIGTYSHIHITCACTPVHLHIQTQRGLGFSRCCRKHESCESQPCRQNCHFMVAVVSCVHLTPAVPVPCYGPSAGSNVPSSVTELC